MQFLFKYIDDLVGKGLEWYIIVELLLYASSSLVPMALPLAILLSSIMTFGNLGEHYELVALKSAGISLRRIMMPLIILVFFICIAAFYFANNVMPYANLKMYSLLYDVRQQKPGLVIKEGIFYNGIEGYSIRVGKKDADNQTLHDIMIYDHTNQKGNDNVLVAKHGKMYKSDDERFLIIQLFNGTNYKEMDSKEGMADRRQHLRVHFKEHEVKFDLSAFRLSRTDEGLFKDHQSMLSISQLNKSEDSLQQNIREQYVSFRRNVYTFFEYFRDSADMKRYTPVPLLINNDKNILQQFSHSERLSSVSRAFNTARNIKGFVESAVLERDNLEKQIRRHQIEWHRKFTLAVACLILFFIGAPLGAIIRKGGLGMPVVISIFFFIFFHILSISGEKFTKEGVLPAAQGMWIASLILTPVGLFITRQAITDSALFDLETYSRFALRFFRRFKSRKT